jgi:hypothetical protein
VGRGADLDGMRLGVGQCFLAHVGI